MTGLLLVGGEVDGTLGDLRIRDGVIVERAPRLAARRGEDVFDVAGGAVLPGLADHHLHLLAMGAARRSVALGPPDVVDRDGFVAALRRAVTSASPHRWVRGVGYHESVAGRLDRDVLDGIVEGMPLRIQHRSGALWVLNSAAVARLGVDGADAPEGVERDATGRLTGRLWRLDAWLSERLGHERPAGEEPPALTEVGEALLRHGVTAVTDATPHADRAGIELIAAAIGRGELPQRVALCGAPGLEWTPPEGVEQGPAKILQADHSDPSFEQMVTEISRARAQGRPVAVHAVTSVAAVLAVAAIEELGSMPGDRIEHGALIPRGLDERIARLGITVVTNPGFVSERGDTYLAEVDKADQPDLWRCGSLLAAGVGVAGGTDAPFGPENPWVAIAAASRRLSRAGRSVVPLEAVDAMRALRLFLGPLHDPAGSPRRVAQGEVADMCILGVPLHVALDDLAAVHPRATIVGGRLWDWGDS